MARAVFIISNIWRVVVMTCGAEEYSRSLVRALLPSMCDMPLEHTYVFI